MIEKHDIVKGREVMVMDKAEVKLQCFRFASEVLGGKSDEKSPIGTQRILEDAKVIYKWVSSERKDEE